MGSEKPQRRGEKTQSHISEITAIRNLVSLFLTFRGLKITSFFPYQNGIILHTVFYSFAFLI